MDEGGVHLRWKPNHDQDQRKRRQRVLRCFSSGWQNLVGERKERNLLPQFRDSTACQTPAYKIPAYEMTVASIRRASCQRRQTIATGCEILPDDNSSERYSRRQP